MGNEKQSLQNKPDMAKCLLKCHQANLDTIQNLLHLKFWRQYQIAIHGTVLALMVGIMMIMTGLFNNLLMFCMKRMFMHSGGM